MADFVAFIPVVPVRIRTENDFFRYPLYRPLSVLLQGLMGFLHQSVQVKRLQLVSGTLLQEAQILDVPLRPPDGRIGQSQNTEARFPCVLQIVLQHLLMHSRVPDNALFAHLFPAGLELGLYQTGHLTAVLQNAGHRRQDQLQGDKAHVDAMAKSSSIRDLLRGSDTGRWCAPCTPHGGRSRSFQASWP